MTFLQLICLAVLVVHGLCCTNKNGASAGLGNVFQRLVGKDVTTSPYNGNDNPVAACDELNCDFEGGSCCWSNANPPADQQDWVTLNGAAEQRKLQSSFGTTTAPSGTAAAVGSETSDGSAQQAHLYSCPITCVDGPVTVRLRHWQTKDVTVQVCQENDPSGPPTNCRSLPSSSGNTDSVQLPGGQNTRLVVLARGFTVKSGSVAMVDEINVQCKACVTTTTTQATLAPPPPPPPPPPPAGPATVPPATCTALKCNFESHGTCSYTPATSGGGTKQWSSVQGPYQNALTGIKQAAEGTYFAGTYLNPGDTAVMSTNVDFVDGYTMSFYGYRATEGIDLMGCCGDTANCPFSTSNKVQVSDYRSWKQATVTCPSGTKSVLFRAVNSGKNYGAAGLDNIQVLAAGSNTNAC